jgi:hypothetical protein
MGPVARKVRQAPRHAANHNLDEYLEAYIEGVDLEEDPKGASIPHGGLEIRCAHTTAAERLPDDSEAS